MESSSVSARVESYSPLEGGRGSAVLELSFRGSTYRILVENLAKKPYKAEASVEGEHVVIRLLDEEDRGFASCYIHVSHLERGCVDCRCLLKPAG